MQVDGGDVNEGSIDVLYKAKYTTHYDRMGLVCQQSIC
jgi:hypothetical protein